MEIHQFNTKVAEVYGIEEAILLTNLRWWVKHNEANGTNCHDGRYWTYNSAKAFRELFPYMSEWSIGRALKKLEANGLIVTGNYNASAYDRTKWYSVTEKGESFFSGTAVEETTETTEQNRKVHSAKLQNQSSENAKPIPDINTDINADINDSAQGANFDFRKELLKLGVDKQVADDWLSVRKAKRAANTKTALQGVIREAGKAGISVAEAVEFACASSWQGFKAEWYNNKVKREYGSGNVRSANGRYEPVDRNEHGTEKRPF